MLSWAKGILVIWVGLSFALLSQAALRPPCEIWVEAGEFAGQDQAPEASPVLERVAYLPGENSPPGSRMDRAQLLKSGLEALPPLGRVSPSSTKADRYRLIRPLPLRLLMAKPGHRVLRDPGAVLNLTRALSTGEYRSATVPAEMPSLNLVTDATGEIVSVDVWEGHHRILARMQNGGRICEDLPFEELRIYVNGIEIEGEASHPPYEIPAAGSDLRGAWRWIPAERTEQGWPYARKTSSRRTVVANGANSNRDTGSRESLGMVMDRMNDEDPPKIGVFLHRGRTLPTLSALARWEREGYDEIVVVPEDAVPAPELLPAIIALNERLKEQGTIRLNLYVTRDSEEFAANFNIPQSDSHPGYDTFMNLIRQIYATRTPVTEVR